MIRPAIPSTDVSTEFLVEITGRSIGESTCYQCKRDTRKILCVVAKVMKIYKTPNDSWRNTYVSDRFYCSQECIDAQLVVCVLETEGRS